jgi:hypothetical protein
VSAAIPNFHTQECCAAIRRVETEQTAWNARWPGACRTCDGFGVFGSPASWEEPGGSDPCDDCTGQGYCARCGKPGLTPDTGAGPCSVCGWNYDDARPQFAACDCHMRLAEDFP